MTTGFIAANLQKRKEKRAVFLKFFFFFFKETRKAWGSESKNGPKSCSFP
jgi:hypothetical protein